MNLIIKSVFTISLMLILLVSNALAQNEKSVLPVKTIELIHCTHTDYGFTDHPLIDDELQKRYLDIALDAIIETSKNADGQKFYWTAEVLDHVNEWWIQASGERRQQFLKAVKSGQMDINALPYNIQPFANERQWNTMLHWIPDELWNEFEPKIGMQNDVNGFPRTAAIGLLNKGIRYLWSGINHHWGGSPFQQPYAFWWKMPDGRKLLVWLGQSYWMGYDLFSEREWRSAQREASNTQFRTPRINDILAADEKSVREAHRICVKKLQKMVDEGYPYDFLAISITNQWRIDNDGPFPPIVEFVKKWNDLGLQPNINLTTASKAMQSIESKYGNTLQTYEGEWTDWWAFGGAATPRELAASRLANNYVEAALSPVWGSVTDNIKINVSRIDRELCRFYEHTCGANEATSNPYSLFSLGHFTEKNIYAYRPYERAKWLLAQQTRLRFTNEPEGLYVTNTGQTPYSGWVELDRISFRGEKYNSVKNTSNGEKTPLLIKGETARFWVENMPANKFYRFLLQKDSVIIEMKSLKPEIKTDQLGWPVEVKWKKMSSPLFTESLGNFMSLESKVGRGIAGHIWWENDSIRRKQKVKEATAENWARTTDTTKVTETANSIIYEQKFTHPRLKWAIRKLEIWKNEPRVQTSIKFFRLSSSNPEIFYVEFPLPETGAFPVTSNGGNEFQPYKQQLPRTCTDFVTIDGWVHYPSPIGSWIWSGRESALVSFDSQQLAVKSMTPPKRMNTILAMVYNNMWEVNYLDDCPGEMEFHFDLVWKEKISDSREIPKIVQTYYFPPVVMLNPATREDKHTFLRMNEIK